jgi:hypothetical protein
MKWVVTVSVPGHAPQVIYVVAPNAKKAKAVEDVCGKAHGVVPVATSAERVTALGVVQAWVHERVQVRDGRRVLVLNEEEARALLSTKEGRDLVCDRVDVSAAFLKEVDGCSEDLERKETP